MLHAGAVELPDRAAAIAIAGYSGAGKSTATALLCSASAPLFTDDALAVTTGSKPLQSARGTDTLRLRPQAADLARRIPGGKIGTTADGRVSVQPPFSRHPTLPLGLVAMVRPDREHDQISTDRLHGIEAAKALLSAHRVIGWTDPARQRAIFTRFTDLAASIPVIELNVPWADDFAADAGERLIEALDPMLDQPDTTPT